MDKTRLTRRRAIQLPVAAAAVLAGALPAISQEAAAQQIPTGPSETVVMAPMLSRVVHTEDLAQRCQMLHAEYMEASKISSELSHQIERGKSDAEREAFVEASDARTLVGVLELDWYVSEIARHLPGLAPVIEMLVDHISHRAYYEPGACCTEATTFEA